MSDTKSQSYEDIIHLPHPTSSKHPRMPLLDRAAQFSPFAALTGHEQAIEETARLTEHQRELNEDVLVRLNEKLQMLERGMEQRVTITYFVPDDRKTGGAYQTCTDFVRKVDRFTRCVVMNNQTVIPVEQIREIEWYGTEDE